MNFFEHQDRARRSTRWLVLMFLAAVAGVVAAVDLVVLGTLGSHAGAGGALAAVSLGTLSIIGGGSLYKTAQLSGGGETVASLLGGRPLDPNSRDAVERRLLNVVEEMAVASGVPVPTVYVMDGEPGINAFAAGWKPDDAVIGVTRGTLELLNRDELQGVVAHEFSHIFNGDMRLNIRLIGLLHGILVIGLIGYWLMRLSGSSRSSSRDGAGKAALPMLGLAIYVIGSVGTLFGKLIKGAVSRQREYLADAAAVQYTRNPEGLAGALKKIGGLAAGSRVRSPNAAQASHLFFGSSGGASWLGWMATHPPLADRIRRLDPDFDGTYPEVVPVPAALEPDGAASKAPPRQAALMGAGLGRVLGGVMAGGLRRGPQEIAAGAGHPGPLDLAYATGVLAALESELPAAARDPASARALVLGLLVDRDGEVRRRQLELFGDDPWLAGEVLRLLPLLDATPIEARLPLAELAVPALRRLSPVQYTTFRSRVEALAEADRRLSLFEFTLHRQLLRHLQDTFEPRRVRRSGPAAGAREPAAALLLSSLAQAAHADAGRAARAYASAQAERGLEPSALPPLVAREACTLPAIDTALESLSGLPPQQRGALLAAAVSALGVEAGAGEERRELLRCLADALECPLPPVLDGTGSDADAAGGT